jgi:hypothetical protein
MLKLILLELYLIFFIWLFLTKIICKFDTSKNKPILQK